MKAVALFLLVPLLVVVVAASPSSSPENTATARRTRTRGGPGGLRAVSDLAILKDIEEETAKFWTRELEQEDIEEETVKFWTRELQMSGSISKNCDAVMGIHFKVDSICVGGLDEAGVESLRDAMLAFAEERTSCLGILTLTYEEFELTDYEDPEDCATSGGSTSMSGLLKGHYARRALSADHRALSVCPGESECPSPCTDTNIANGDFYHPHCINEDMYIQCDEYKGCFEMSCGNNTVWSQPHLTCVHADGRSGPACDDTEILANALRSGGFDIDSVTDLMMKQER